MDCSRDVIHFGERSLRKDRGGGGRGGGGGVVVVVAVGGAGGVRGGGCLGVVQPR